MLLVRGEERLGGLIEQQDPRNRTSVFDEVAVQGEQGDDVVIDPVLAAADVLVQPYRALPIASDHGERDGVELDAVGR